MDEANNLPSPATTRNHDVLGIYTRMNRFIEEVQLSVSSATSQMNEFDQTRLQSYINSVNGYLDYVVGQPQLDLPETSPREYKFEPIPEEKDTESEEVNDIRQLFV